MVPAPILRLKEGETVAIHVTNQLAQPSSIHWHGILLPFDMDGVPGLAFPGIAPGETFTYRFKVQQSGTYWYHSHSKFQEQTGLYGPLILDPAGADPIQADRDYVVMLSDWSDREPEWIFRRLKQSSDFFNYQMPTVGDLVQDIRTMGWAQAIDKRKMWNAMRMNPTDLGDVSGAAYTYLANGMSPAANWTAIARPGERVRLRVINGSATTIFDVRIPGLKMTVVSADGQDVEPVAVDEFRISVAETYDVIVQLPDERAYTIFAQSIDRSGYARATLAPRAAWQPPCRRWTRKPGFPWSTWEWAVCGMEGMEGHDMSGHSGQSDASQRSMQGHDMAEMRHGEQEHGKTGMPGHGMGNMHGMQHDNQPAPQQMPGHGKAAGNGMKDMKGLDTEPGVDARVMSPSTSLADPGPRLRDNGRRVLTYADLRTIGGPLDPRPPSRELCCA
jgi:CopA family copper-resistance protein